MFALPTCDSWGIAVRVPQPFVGQTLKIELRQRDRASAVQLSNAIGCTEQRRRQGTNSLPRFLFASARRDERRLAANVSPLPRCCRSEEHTSELQSRGHL